LRGFPSILFNFIGGIIMPLITAKQARTLTQEKIDKGLLEEEQQLITEIDKAINDKKNSKFYIDFYYPISLTMQQKLRKLEYKIVVHTGTDYRDPAYTRISWGEKDDN
jgi:hypothetical protein